MKHTILLPVLCIIPYMTHAMDKPGHTIPQALAIHARPVQSLYISTHLMLTNFNHHEKNTRKELIEIIEKMNSLKSAQPPLQEKEIGFYIYQQKTEASLTDSLKNSLFGSIPMPIIESIFFARLGEYNKDLEKKGLTSPNKQQVANYFKKLAIQDLATKNAEHSIIIPQQTIDAVTISDPTGIGIKEFATLWADITAFFNSYSRKEMLQTAKLIYHDELVRRRTQR